MLYPTPLEKLSSPVFDKKGLEIWVKRDDLCHPEVSGNKFRKLKFNLLKAKELKKETLISFGGAYSNHIYALAAAAQLFDFKSEAIIRGQELNENSSPTLTFASQKGMKMHFVTRSDYRDKAALSSNFSDESKFFIPEGGSNQYALPGCAEIIDEVLTEITPTHFCLAAGTGGTAAGVLSNKNFKGEVYGFPALKNGGFLINEIQGLLQEPTDRLSFFEEYHFGGYAKYNDTLLKFIKDFESEFDILLEHIYTAKLFFGVFDLIEKGQFPTGSKIVIYHSGGLQGRLPILSEN
ncbi:1-aminocyclopropane-1-carboxylate deaminase [Arcticibacterium luteifluviistationis]|uniref:1-aminocyclopropane-1-carboxylate deaminase n=1 Tax=Arcticibacterium luteifluviistationis TaxID=1784714 RepID=A0A2Z4GHH7_9BACT|nr:1-aminocyclopropane-1-carboxylate deaminase [Arcticibacterium luteifluviistationis]